MPAVNADVKCHFLRDIDGVIDRHIHAEYKSDQFWHVDCNNERFHECNKLFE